MTETHQHPGVPVSIDRIGTIHVGAAHGSAPWAASLVVAGGLLSVDPFAPDQPPHAEIEAAVDEDDLGWVAPVYGWDVAEAVLTARSAAPWTEDPRPRLVATAKWTPGDLHVPTARLAITRWLAAWAPAPYDEVLLDAEIGHLSLICADLSAEGEEAARRTFDGILEPLTGLVKRMLRDDVPVVDTIAAPAVREIFRSASAVLDPAEPEAAPLRQALSRIDERLVGEDGRAQLTRVGIQAPDPHQADTYAVDEWRKATVDLLQVPAQSVREVEHNVLWRVVGSTVEAEVLTGSRAARTGELWARVYEFGTPFPVAIGPLELSASGVWAGRLPLRGNDPREHLTIDVFHPRFRRRPRLGPAAGLARLEREAVRTLTELRLDLLRDRRRHVQLAAGRLQDLVDELVTQGHDDPPAPRLTALAEGIRSRGAPRPGLPDVEHPAWAPTLAEQVHLMPTLLGG
ncbi:hypothetical protein B0I31_114135 [Saccharothrix carnea]|uniref:Uncharacterized protein n=1 Tax=Saccharothrix carnea TaxID=1280637 RepID=A0A2P8I1H5_SACCR|nr:hypothetical protein [Saccharothrix carnea]PSL52308.1 hypothetical protein B0I31_114135 [Saccharothrix carnea]